eukprot:NODE_250_length_11764_cov_1.155594.p8 type:complete len:103 gc:universal NODE_250_length_11764_cov_1.155594:5553-5245(-)
MMIKHTRDLDTVKYKSQLELIKKAVQLNISSHTNAMEVCNEEDLCVVESQVCVLENPVIFSLNIIIYDDRGDGNYFPIRFEFVSNIATIKTFMPSKTKGKKY